MGRDKFKIIDDEQLVSKLLNHIVTSADGEMFSTAPVYWACVWAWLSGPVRALVCAAWLRN
jgi:hypothetical protein